MTDRDWYEEHEIDPLDVADSYALLDDGQVLAAVVPVDDEAADAQEFFLHHHEYRHRPYRLTRDR